MSAETSILIANRGEIAVRLIRAARAAGLRTVAVHASDEEVLGTGGGLHLRLADEVVTLPGRGTAAYLDASAIVAAARGAGASLVHPGYGFLAESADLARRCAEAGLTWVGPDPHALELFGDKTATRAHALAVGVPVPAATGLLETTAPGTPPPAGAGGDCAAGDDPSVVEVRALLAAHPAGVAIKAVAGGGGRGIRIVHEADALPEALTACAAEARAGFGDGRVFAEALVVDARHIEVQVLGTPEGVHVLGDRDCSIQRRRQKLVEIAPAPGLGEDLRARIHADALRLRGAPVLSVAGDRRVPRDGRLPCPPRGEPADPGGAHRDGGSHGDQPRRLPARSGRMQRTCPSPRSGPARHRRPAARRSGDGVSGRGPGAQRGANDRGHLAHWSRRARRYVDRSGQHRDGRVRFASGEDHRARRQP